MEQQQANASIRAADVSPDQNGTDFDRVSAMRVTGRDASASREQPAMEGMVWLVNMGGEETLEMCHADIEAAWCAGRIDASTLVWRETMADWKPIEAVPLLSMVLPAQSRREPASPPAAAGQAARPPSAPPPDPHSLDFAAAKRRRRSSIPGVSGPRPSPPNAQSASPGPESFPSSSPPSAQSASPGPGSSPSSGPGSPMAHSPSPRPGSSSLTPPAASTLLAQLTMHAIARVEPHSDDSSRPVTPWTVGPTRSGMPPAPTPAVLPADERPTERPPSISAADAGTRPRSGPDAVRDAESVDDAAFEKDFETLWADGLDPDAALRAAPSSTPESGSDGAAFEAEFAELWAQGPEPAPAPLEELHALSSQTEQARSEEKGAAKTPTLEVAALGVPQDDGQPSAALVELASTSTEQPERPRAVPIESRETPAPSSSATAGLSLRPAIDHAPEATSLLPSEKQPSTAASETPKGPSVDALRDLRPARAEQPSASPLSPIPPREPSHSALPPIPPRTGARTTLAGLGVAAASGNPTARPSAFPRVEDAAAAPAAASDTSRSPVGQRSIRPPPPRSSAAAARASSGSDADSSSPNQHDPRRPSFPSPSRSSLPSNAPLAREPSAPPVAPNAPTARPEVGPPAIAVFERRAPTLVFGDAPVIVTEAPALAGPPPLPVASPSLTTSPATTASEFGSGAGGQLGFGEADFLAALKRRPQWSPRAWVAASGALWTSLTDKTQASRKAVIGVSVGAVIAIALILALALSSNDAPESASSQEATSGLKAATATPKRASVTEDTPTSNTDRGEPSSADSTVLRGNNGKRTPPGASRPSPSRVASAEELDRNLDKTLQDWSSGAAMPKEAVAPPKPKRPTIARRPQSRISRSRPRSAVAPSMSGNNDNAPKKTAWDPTNPGF